MRTVFTPTPKTPSKDGPKTGDDADVGKWAAIAAIALAAVGVGGYCLYSTGKQDDKKKKKK